MARTISISFFGNDAPLRRAMEQSGQAVEGLQGKFEKLDGVLGGAGLAGGAAFAGALMKGLDVSAARGKLQAQLGLTKAESAKVGKVAGDLYSSAYGESMDDVNTAITSVIQNMDGMRGATDAALKTVTAQAMTAGQVLDADVGETTRAVAQMMRTGLAKSSQEAFDILVRGAQMGANKSQDLLDTFNEYGTQFRKLGLDGQTAMGIITQGLQAGARDADLVADAIKEFSIRAVDGSTSTAAGFKSLGLSATQMAAAIARGGRPASQALDLVMQRLRAVRDPVKQAQIATELFGTQAEDLGKALYAINPSTAVSSLGKFKGATDAASRAMGQTADAKFKKFKRSLETNLVNTIVNDVLPQLEKLQSVGSKLGITPSGIVQAGLALTGLSLAFKGVGIAANIATASVGRFSIASTFSAGATAAAQFVGGLRNVELAYAANATVATRLGAAIRAQILLWRQQAAAAGVSTARIILQAAAQRVVAVATRAWAIAQALLNAVMDANPIALVVIAVAALVAGFVLAYKKSETFRNIVNATWNAIKNGVMVAVNFIVGFVRDHWRLLGTILLGPLGPLFFLISTFWRQIWGAIQAAWAVIHPILNAIASVLRGTFRVAWVIIQNTIKIVWIAIQIYIKVAWFAIRMYFNLIKAYITQVLAPIFRWLYSNVVKPVWAAIKTAIAVQWTAIKVVFNAIKSFLSSTLAPAFRAFKSAASAAWSALKSAMSSVYRSGIKPIFDGLKTVLSSMKGAFRTAVSGIKAEWDKLRGAAKAPVNFVIGLYNNGVVKLVNAIADFALGKGKGNLNPIKPFATGGIYPGYTPGRDIGLAAVSGGEAIMRPEFTRAVGSDFIHAANRTARTGGPGAVRRWLAGRDALGGEGMAFARGGIVPPFAGRFSLGGIVGGFVDGLKKFAFGAPEKALKSAMNKILGGHVPGTGYFRDLIAKIPSWIADKILGWFKGKVSSGGGGLIGGGGFAKALAWAKSQAGKPYVWGGVGPGGYDCSGFMSAITNVIHGKNPYSRLFSTRSFGASGGPGGFVRNANSAFRVGVTNAGVGHMAGTLNGVNVESSGSRGVHYGPSARGANDPLFGYHYGLRTATYDSGGLLQPGYTLAYNGTGRPELVSKLTTSRVGSSQDTRTVDPAARSRAGLALLKQITSALLSSTSKISSFFASLNAQIKKFYSGGAEKQMLAWSAGIQKAMSAAAAKAADIAGKISAAKDYAADITNSAKDYASLSSLGSAGSAVGIATGLAGRAANLQKFASQLSQLKARGLNSSLLSQIIGMGAGQGSALAATLLAGDSETLKAINGAQGQIDTLAGNLGKTAANVMYDSGKNAGKGFLSGLYGQQADLNKLMDQLGRRLAGGVRKGFGIPSKPSAHRDSLPYALRADTGALALAPGWNPPVYNGTGSVEYLETPRAGGVATARPAVVIESVTVTEKADIDMLINQLEFRLRGATL